MASHSGRKGKGPNAHSLLSPSSYDKDAPTYTSVPSVEDVRASSSSIHLDVPESGSDDDNLQASDDDRDVLLEEEEREKLLSKSGIFGSIGRKEGVVIGKRVKRKKKTRQLSTEPREERDSASRDKLDAPYSDHVSSSSDDEIGRIRCHFDEKLSKDFKPRSSSCRRLVCIIVSLLTFLSILLAGSLQLSFRGRSITQIPFHATPLSNGTHTFYPTTIYISMDGLRADYIDRGLTPTIQSLINSGVTTPYMIPSFPAVTFPNHWTLVTGLYPESHGIVGNTFYDPHLKEHYVSVDVNNSMNPIWYGGKSIWSVAEENGIKTAVHMWPGSEQCTYYPEQCYSTFSEFTSSEAKPKHNKMQHKPSYVDPFSPTEALPRKVDRILSFLDFSLEERPQLILSYVPNIDSIGHQFGPNTTEENNELTKIDNMIHLLLEGLDARNLTEIINIVIVSDHGMATVLDDRVLYIEDILGASKGDVILPSEGSPSIGLRPRDGTNILDTFKVISEIRRRWPGVNNTNNEPPWNVYLRDVNMPERLHFTHNERIAPLWIFPDAGWVITNEEDFPRGSKGWHPRGVHGYDNLHPLMRAIFIAHGPAFRDAGLHGDGNEWQELVDNSPDSNSEDSTKGEKEFQTKQKLDKRSQETFGRVVKPFSNIEVYGIIGSLLFGTDNKALEEVLGPHNGTFVGGVKGLGLTIISEERKGSQISSPSASTPTPLSFTPSTLLSITGSQDSKSIATLQSISTAARPTSSDIPSLSTRPTIPVVPSVLASTIASDSDAVSTPPPASTSPSSDSNSDIDKGKDTDDPENLTWWDYIKWKAQRLKETMENWWGKVWTEEMDKFEHDMESKKEGKDSSK